MNGAVHGVATTVASTPGGKRPERAAPLGEPGPRAGEPRAEFGDA